MACGVVCGSEVGATSVGAGLLPTDRDRRAVECAEQVADSTRGVARGVQPAKRVADISALADADRVRYLDALRERNAGEEVGVASCGQQRPQVEANGEPAVLDDLRDKLASKVVDFDCSFHSLEAGGVTAQALLVGRQCVAAGVHLQYERCCQRVL